MHRIRKNERGNVTIIVLAVILLVMLVLVALKLTDKAANKTTKSTESSQNDQQSQDESVSDSSTESDIEKLESLTSAARNTARKNDASRLAAATQEYVANNVGFMPHAFENGYLIGGGSPSRVQFDHYGTTRVELSEHPAITKDEIILVTHASCDQNGAAIESTSRNAAVLYALEGDGGRWDGVCSDL